jgi:hypothetical protein
MVMPETVGTTSSHQAMWPYGRRFEPLDGDESAVLGVVTGSGRSLQMIRYGPVARSCDRLRRREWHEESCRLSGGEVLVCETHGGGAVADSRSDALHRAVAGVSCGEDSRH